MYLGSIFWLYENIRKHYELVTRVEIQFTIGLFPGKKNKVWIESLARGEEEDLNFIVANDHAS